MNVGLQKTSLVNFPGRVAATVFLPGCNLRCPFCHNAELACASVVSGPKPATSSATKAAMSPAAATAPGPANASAAATDEGNEFVPIGEAHAHLEKRARVLGGLAVTGGEPLLSPALAALIAKARSLGLAVKIDTNGTLPDRLRAILDDPATRPDMVAIDVKTSPARYRELAAESEAGDRAGADLLRSLAVLASEAGRPGPTQAGAAAPRTPAGAARQAGPLPLRVEYRTVLVPGLVGEAELREIGSLLPPGADWQLARFSAGHCLDPALNDVTPYGPAETDRLLAIARSAVPGAKLR